MTTLLIEMYEHFINSTVIVTKAPYSRLFSRVKIAFMGVNLQNIIFIQLHCSTSFLEKMDASIANMYHCGVVLNKFTLYSSQLFF